MSGSRVPEVGPRRHAAVLAVGSAAAGATAAAAAWHLARLVPWAVGGQPRGPAGPLLAVACLLATIVLGRLCLAAVAAAACGAAACLAPTRASSGSVRQLYARLAVALSPRLLRPLLASVLAGAVALGTAASANAAATPGTVRTQASTSVLHRGAATIPTGTDVGHDALPLPDPGWSSGSGDGYQPAALPAPTWTAKRPPAPRRDHVDVRTVAAAPSRAPEPAPVVVRRDDTLWSIAARHLGAGATDADVAREWPRWWRANRATLGADPNLLLPGQVLIAPSSQGAR